VTWCAQEARGAKESADKELQEKVAHARAMVDALTEQVHHPTPLENGSLPPLEIQ
jgi:hypothetical protein